MGDSPAYPIQSSRDAEQAACSAMRSWGYTDAHLSPKGPDGGIDVESGSCVAQVKAHIAPIGIADVQRLLGTAVARGKVPVFFALAGYTSRASEWAEDAGVALFTFNLAGQPLAKNSSAHDFIEAADGSETDVQVENQIRSQWHMRPENFESWSRQDVDELRRMAESGDLRAITVLSEYLKTSNPDESERLLRKAVEMGDSVAMLSLASLIRKSDPKEAEMWYMHSARAGQQLAVSMLGTFYWANGDIEQARTWLTRAAEEGDATDWTTLAEFFQLHYPDEAEKCFQRAMDDGDPEAILPLAEILDATGRKGAEQLYRLSADSNNVDGMVKLGIYLEKIDSTEAEFWLRRTCALGDVRGMWELAVLIEDRDPVEARTWYDKIVLVEPEENEAYYAHYRIARMLVGTDIEAAVEFIRMEPGYNLGYLAILALEEHREQAMLLMSMALDEEDITAMWFVGSFRKKDNAACLDRFWRDLETGDEATLRKIASELEHLGVDAEVERWLSRADRPES